VRRPGHSSSDTRLEPVGAQRQSDRFDRERDREHDPDPDPDRDRDLDLDREHDPDLDLDLSAGSRAFAACGSRRRSDLRR
jgi:hypothetical protein